MRQVVSHGVLQTPENTNGTRPKDFIGPVRYNLSIISTIVGLYLIVEGTSNARMPIFRDHRDPKSVPKPGDSGENCDPRAMPPCLGRQGHTLSHRPPLSGIWYRLAP